MRIISCILLKGYGGAVSNGIALGRNITEVKGKYTKQIAVGFTLLVGSYGILQYIITKNLWDILPCLASVEYTIATFLLEDYRHCKLALLFNELLWLSYLFLIQSYVSGITMIVLAISTLIACFRKPAKKRFKEDKEVAVNVFRGDNFYLSNMYSCEVPMVINGKTYLFSSAEAAFQAHKDVKRASEFVGISGKEAKSLGRRVNMRQDWERVKDDIMRACVRAKFENNLDLAKKLKNTDGFIVENNTWGDRYWGVCGGVGKNRLGQILMEERSHMVEKDMKVFEDATKASEDEVCEFLAMINNDDVDLRDLV